MKKLAGIVIILLIAGITWFQIQKKTTKITKPKENKTKNNNTIPDDTSKRIPYKGKTPKATSHKKTRKRVQYLFVAGREIREPFEYNNKSSYIFQLQRDEKRKNMAPQNISMDISCKGTLKITCYKTNKHSSFIGYQIEGSVLTLLGNGKPIQKSNKIIQSFSHEIFLEQDHMGNILSLYFPKIHPVTKNFWRQVFSLRMVVFSDRNEKKWLAKGENTIGTYIAKYTMKKKEEKKKYLITKELKNFINFKYKTSERFVAKDLVKKLQEKHFKLVKFKSISKYFFDKKIGQASKMDVMEEGKMKIMQAFPIEASYTTKWKSQIESIKVSDVKSLLADLCKRLNVNSISGIKNSLETSNLGEIDQTKKEYTQEQKEKAKKDFERVMKDIQTIFASGKFDAKKVSKLFQEASGLVKINPEILKMISQNLKEGRNLDIKGFLVDILADVGSNEAQDLIIDSFTDPNSGTKFRNRTMFSTLFVKSPNAKFRAAVVSTFQNSAPNSELKGLSLRSIGAIAHKYKDSDKNLSNQMIHQIVQYKKEAYTVDQKLSVIDALGNSHMKSAAKELEDYLDSSQSELVRAATVRTLAKSESDYALGVVNKELSKNQSHGVVEDALRSFWNKNWKKHSQKTRNETLQVLRKLKEKYAKENKEMEKAISQVYDKIRLQK